MLDILYEFSSIINNLEILQSEDRISFSKLKIRIELTDGSLLFLREILIENVLTDYSYHWMKPDETLIARWDNTLHESYKSIPSFPHHKHVPDQFEVQPSDEKNLREVLSFILNKLNTD